MLRRLDAPQQVAQRQQQARAPQADALVLFLRGAPELRLRSATAVSASVLRRRSWARMNVAQEMRRQQWA